MYNLLLFINIATYFDHNFVILYYIPLTYSLLSNLSTNTDLYCIQRVWLLESVHLKPDDDQNCGRNM
jgi:hypothetical protein